MNVSRHHSHSYIINHRVKTKLCVQDFKMAKTFKASLKSTVTAIRKKRQPSRKAVQSLNNSCYGVRRAVKHFSTETLDSMAQSREENRRNVRTNEVPPNSIKRRLRNPVYEYVITSKPLLSTKIRKKRLEWAKSHENWTIKDWSNVLWTGRTKFDTSTFKRSVYVWGCFSRAGVGDLLPTREEMSQDEYELIMEKHAIPAGLRLVGDSFTMQQGNSSKYYFAVYTSAFIPAHEEAEIVFRNMEWPDQSSDISPMKFLWDQLERNARLQHPFTKKHLWQILEDTWNAITPKQVEKFVAAMPRICEAVIKNKGGLIDESVL